MLGRIEELLYGLKDVSVIAAAYRAAAPGLVWHAGHLRQAYAGQEWPQ